MQERLRTLRDRSKARELTSLERLELDEYERIEHLVIMLKADNLQDLTSTPSVLNSDDRLAEQQRLLG
jgi:hypothetical protein